MSFWDLAQTAGTIVAGVYGGPIAGAAVGGGLSALRGKDPLMGAVSGYMGGMGGQGMNAAASQTALKAGTTNAALNSANLAGQGITTGTNLMQPTMASFGGAGAGTGITQGVNTGLGNVYNANLGVGKGFPSMTNPTPQFGSVRGNLTVGGEQIGANYPNYTNPTPGFTGPNTGLQNTEIGADFKPNTDFATGLEKGQRQYEFVDQSTQMPVDGYSMSEKFDAVVNNPRDFLKNYGGGNELYGAGKVGLTGLGMYASAMEPEDGYGYGYGDMKISGDDVRNRGPQGQLNLAGLSSLNVNNPYGYAEGGYLSGGNVPGDGMSDSIPAMIGRGQQAALSEGEFVIPADVVSHLGNGSSNAGSKQLYAMMDQVRKDRTGTTKQGKEINPERYMPA